MALAQGFIHRLRSLEPEEALEVAVIVPPGFRSLGFAADLVIEYPSELMRYSAYEEVSELTDATWTKVRRFASDSRRSVGIKISPFLGNNKRARLLALALASSPRSLKIYWLNLKLQFWVHKKVRDLSRVNRRVEFWPVNDWLCVSGEGLEYRSISLSESFQHRFEVLYDAISTGLTFAPASSQFSAIPQSFQAPDVLVRSRNFAFKAPGHNSDYDTLKDLVLSLLGSGKSVVHCGSPILPLHIEHENYLEVSNINLDEEMSLLAEGGSFIRKERLACSH